MKSIRIKLRTVIDVFLTDLLKDPGNNQKIKPKYSLSIFFISLQDELMRIFGGDSIDGMLKKLGLKKGESIDLSLIHI